MEEKRSPALPERKGPEIRYTGKKKHTPLKWARILLCLAGILTAAAGLGAEISLRPKMAALARAETLRQLSLLTARATAEFAAAGEMDYRDLVKMEFDPAGRLMAVRCDTGALNALSARMVCRVEEELERQGAFSVRVPLGTLFGGFLFAGKGLPVRVRIVPVGGVTGRIQSRVESAGVNQSRHCVSLCLDFRVVAALPGRDEEIRETLTVPLCENLFLGEVPEIAAVR